MKKESNSNDSLSNIVEFPNRLDASGFSSLSLGNDPIEDLLNEFKDFEFVEEFDDWEDFEIDDTLFEDYVVETSLEGSESVELLKQQIETLEEINNRLKYYVGEINTHRQRF